MIFRRACVILTLASLAIAFAAEAETGATPRLVVFVVIDQLRNDLLERVEDRLVDDGLRYLIDEGTWFTDAQYRHAVTFTAVGHASLATGGNAPEHGMSANGWFDIDAGEEVYCLEDREHHLLHRSAKPHSGTSPKNLLVETWGDVLVKESNGRSRVYSVAIKDRGAIATAGHEGTAFWYDSGLGHFVTSTYYYRQYPAWAAEWNQAGHAQQYRDAAWTLMHPIDTYFAKDDDRPQEVDISGLGRTFPHDLKATPDPFLTSAVRFLPFGIELTLDFAQTLVSAEQLGQDDQVDILNVGLSPSDYIGHSFGPESLEFEDNLLQMDAALAQFFRFLDDTVGLEQTLLVLSADHGSNEVPGEIRNQRERTGLAPPEDWGAEANRMIAEAFDRSGHFVTYVENPWFYLDEKALAQAGIEVAAAADALAAALRAWPGVEVALTGADIEADHLPDGDLGESIRRSYYAPRSGHVMVLPKEGWQLFYKLYDNAGDHGSSWAYDRRVPVLFAGPGIAAQRIARAVAPEDIGPTVNQLLGIRPPSGATGDAYPEIVDGE